MLTRLFFSSLLLAPLGQGLGQIAKPADAPKPLPPAESLKTVRLPDGFRLELVAAEPLIRQPSGVCWDAEGNLFVAELHGYNREGQFDIESCFVPHPHEGSAFPPCLLLSSPSGGTLDECLP